MSIRPFFTSMLSSVLCTVACSSSHAIVFSNDTTIASGETDYDGEEVVVSNCTLTVVGSHSFGAFLVNTAATCRLSGGGTLDVTGTLTVQTNGSVVVESTNRSAKVGGEWKGRGGTITAGHAVIDGGGLMTADGWGYTAARGPGADADGDGGGSHGGTGHANSGNRYGSAREPIDLGSGGSHGSSSPGGGAIHLDVSGTLILNGSITANGHYSHYYNAGAGGSLWVTAGTLTGSGRLTANGGTTSGTRHGGGGRIAVYSDDMAAFTGFADTTALGGANGQRGTVAFYDSAGDDLTVYDHFIFEGGVTTVYENVTLKPGSKTLMNGAATVNVTTTLLIETNATLHVLSTNEAARVGGQWVGRGGTIVAQNATIDGGGQLTADSYGYRAGVGPGIDASDGDGGGSHGGAGHANSGNRYGSAREPVDLGSGGTSGSGAPGGGAIRLDVPGTLTLNGEITANGGYSHYYHAGAGGSLWVTAGTLAGGGRLKANGGTTSATRHGGGGRIAVYTDDMAAFTGLADTTATGGVHGQRGTVAFYDSTGDDLTVYDHFIFEGSATSTCGNLELKHGSTVLLGGAGTLAVTGTLSIESNATLWVLSTNQDAAVEGLWLGRGGAITAGHLTVEAGGVITADHQGYTAQRGPGIDRIDYSGGGTHGGSGLNNQASRYGSFRQPVDLGSGGSHHYSSAGGGAIRIDVGETFTLNGKITANGAYSHEYNAGAGGSIWVTAGSLRGDGFLAASGGTAGSNWNGGGGRISVYSDDTAAFTELSRSVASGNAWGQSGTVGFFDREGTTLDVYSHFVFEADTTPAFDSLTLHTGSVCLLYGEAALTVTNTLTVETNATIWVHSANYTSKILNEWRGAGPAIYAGDLMIHTNGVISADGLGYVSGQGPGIDRTDGSGGGSYGGRGAWGVDPYGTKYVPFHLGSGGTYYIVSARGGGVIRLVVPGTLTLNGLLSADGDGSQYYDGGSGGSVWIETGTFAGTGTVTADGGTGGGGRNGGGGRVAVYYQDDMTFAAGNINTAAIAPAEDGSVFISADPRFVWLRPDESDAWAHDDIVLEWAGGGFDPRTVHVDLTASRGGSTYAVGQGERPRGDVTWDTTIVADGWYELKAAFYSSANGYIGETSHGVLIINAATWHSGTITNNQVWTDDAVHIVEHDVTIAAGVTVTIDPGTVVKLVRGNRIIVADTGILNALGTNDEWVVFTSLSDDTVGGDTNLDGDRSLPQPGDWTGITLQGSGQFNVNELTDMRYMRMAHSGTLVASESWEGTYVHEVIDNLIVPSGTTLTVEPGAIVKLSSLKRIRVQPGGTLIGIGSTARPITFTSMRDDAIGGDTNGDGDTTVPQPGDWMGIHADGGVMRLEHVVIAYSGGQAGGWNADASAIRCDAGGIVSVSNSLVREAFYDGIVGWNGGGNLRVVNTVVENCDRGINVHGTPMVADIVNCSLVNNRIGFWIWSGTIDMDNTIISHSHEAGVHISSPPTQGDMHYCNVWSATGDRFQNMADPTGSNGMISEDPAFRDFAGGNYRPAYGSPCIDAGNTPATPATDKMGAPRYDDPRTDNTGVPDAQGAVADMGAYEFVEGAESDFDLVVTAVSGPAVVTAGEEVAVTWTVRNIGTARVEGSWHDRIRLVPDSAGRWDAPLTAGEALVTTALGPNQTATFNATVRVPGGTEGPWRWEVRANVDGAIFEGIHWNNNTRAARTTSELRIPVVTEGGSISDLYGGENVPVWYKIELSATQEVVAVVNSDMATGRCRLYAGYGDMPTESRFDARSTEWNSPDVRLGLMADGEPVTAYMLLVPERIGDADHNYQISVTATEFDLQSLGLDHAGNAGSVTVPLYGSRLAEGLSAVLRPSSGGDIAADSVLIVNGTTAMATFDLRGAAVGTYDVVIAYGPLERSLAGAFRVFTGTGARLETGVVLPAAVRAGRVFTGYIEYRNVGDANLDAPLLTVQGVGGDVNLWFAGGYNSSNTSFNVLGVAQDNPLPSVLMPGSTYSVEFRAWETIEPTLVVNVSAVKTTDRLPVDYDAIEAAMRPIVPCFLWSNIWQEVVNNGGVTRGEYVAMLGAAADRARSHGLDLMTEWDLLTFLTWEARENIKPASVAGTLYRDNTDNPIARCIVTLAATNQYTTMFATNDTYHAQTWYDGRFGFVNVPPGTYALSAKGYLPRQLLTVDLPDPVGSPVTGLTVIVESRAGTIHGYASDGSAGPPVRGLAVSARNTVTGSSSLGRTDTYGYYTIHSLEPGTYNLTLSASGWLPEAPREVVLGAGDTALESFTLSSKGGQIDGTVRAAGGGTVSNAFVSLTFLDASRGAWAGDSTRTDGTGAYAFTTLPPGRYEVAAAATGHGSSGRHGTRLDGYDDWQTVDMDLAVSVSLTGMVVATAGEAPISGAVVSMNVHPVPPPAAITDASGSFVIDGLVPGEYDVFAIATGYETARTSATIPGGPVTIALSEQGRIHGTVRSGTNILARLPITVMSQSKGLDWQGVTDSRGTYSINNLHTDTYAVTVGSWKGASLGRRKVTLSATQSTARCDFELAVSTVAGMVTQPDGTTPVSNAVVSLVYEEYVVAQRLTGGSGTYEFMIYTPGVFTVMARSADGLPAALTNIVVGTNATLVGRDFTVGTHAIDCMVTAAQGGSPIEDAAVYLQSLSDPTSNALYLVYRTAPDGSCVFDGLADGMYRLRVSADGHALVERDITLPGAGTQAFALETGRVLEGQVTSIALGGAPAAGVVVCVGNAGLGEIDCGVTDGDGHYVFDSLPRGVMDVVATRFDTIDMDVCASVDTRSLAVQTLDLEVGKPSDSEISGRVTNHVGNPVGGATIALVNAAGSHVALGLSDHLGEYRLTGWPSGTFSLEVFAPGYLPGETSLVVSVGVDLTGQGLQLRGPITESSADVILQAPSGARGLTDHLPDFMTYDFWRDILSGDFGLLPPSHHKEQSGGDRLIDEWRAYYSSLDSDKYLSCNRIDAAYDKCAAAEDALFEADRRFTDNWRIYKAVNLANVKVVLGQNALLAARLVKFGATVYELTGRIPNPGTEGLGPQTIEKINGAISGIFNVSDAAGASILRWDFSEITDDVAAISAFIADIMTVAGSAPALAGFLLEVKAIRDDWAQLSRDYKNLDNDLLDRLQQYTDDVNAYLDGVKNLHRAYHDLKAAAALCDNPEEEEPTDDNPPPPDNEGEGNSGGDGGSGTGDGDSGGEDGGSGGGSGGSGDGDGTDGGPTDGPPWDPNDGGGWDPPPTPGGTPPPPGTAGGGSGGTGGTGGGDGSGGTGGGEGGSSGSTDVKGSRDPNDKLTVGFGSAGFVGPDTVLHYTIRFENMTNASLPAFRVTVTDVLTTNLDWSTFEFEALRFNNVTVQVPPGLQSYYNDGVSVPNDPNPVEVQADLDPYTGEIRWRMESVDPVTGGLPEDPFAGFLPPNTNAPAGEGYVKFAIKPRYDAWDTLVITNTADIVFDYNESILTPPVTNTMDMTPPTSAVGALAAASPRIFTVSWAGDDGIGAGIVSYDVYVSREDAAPILWLAGATNSQAAFSGEPGVAYSFYCVARDGVGLTEAAPSGPDAETRTTYYLTGLDSTDGELRMQWESATGMTYRVLRGTSLQTPLTPIASNLPATPPQNTFTTRADRVGEEFYRVEIE